MPQSQSRWIVEPASSDAGRVVIRAAAAADAAELSRFARAIFDESFSWGNDAADMEAYMSEAYSPARQLAEIESADTATFLAEHEGELVGFAQLSRGSAPSCVSGSSPIEVKRFYVATSWHGRGIARDLFDRVLQQARAWGGDVLWLGVWAPNARAISFYRKTGFTEVGTQLFQLGSDAQTDLVMSRSI